LRGYVSSQSQWGFAWRILRFSARPNALDTDVDGFPKNFQTIRLYDTSRAFSMHG
jgi:hypothetical protein